MIFKANKYKLNFSKIYVMGILNITPDSFSDGGRYFDEDNAIERAIEIQEEGADIIDIGAQSTRPGFVKISEKEELKRLIPVLKKIVKVIQIPVSVDTFYPEVAKEAISCDVDIINDVTGFTNPEMIEAVSGSSCGMIVMHNSEKWNGIKSCNKDIKEFFLKQITKIEYCGIGHNRICLDPGIGFGKSFDENLQIISNIDRFRVKNYPVLVGVSKKRFIGQILNDKNENRIIGSVAVNSVLINQNVNILRVHNVKETVQFLKIFNTIKKFEEK
ncbi:MAG: dihydropteroate synthase [Candidatus Improbicoccus pseudotrichonymphae]|uniref:Dihydropteroate synthase n=1 Tax=Candidatus Improbicoccus pseudotrichonymphae TaxID=3033792 RepID=A0AA48I1A4_9FIRM|nr:MAG: dihydropteroate synthase [Candidatus Improbicoccus pseudotrichonymphae]